MAGPSVTVGPVTDPDHQRGMVNVVQQGRHLRLQRQLMRRVEAAGRQWQESYPPTDRERQFMGLAGAKDVFTVVPEANWSLPIRG